MHNFGRVLRQFVQDTRYAVRILTRAKLFTATAVLCLALGIGGNTALFSAVRSVLWTPLPWEDADRIVAIEETNPEGRDHAVSLPNFDDWTEQQTALEELGAVRRLAFNLGGIDRPEHVGGAQVTAGVLQGAPRHPHARPDLHRRGRPARCGSGGDHHDRTARQRVRGRPVGGGLVDPARRQAVHGGRRAAAGLRAAGRDAGRARAARGSGATASLAFRSAALTPTSSPSGGLRPDARWRTRVRSCRGSRIASPRPTPTPIGVRASQ